jgi:hypothetical protein
MVGDLAGSRRQVEQHGEDLQWVDGLADGDPDQALPYPIHSSPSSLSLSLSSTQLHGITKTNMIMPRYAYSLLACFSDKAHITVKQ